MTKDKDIIDQILTSLRIISWIEKGQKVAIRKGLLELEQQSGLRVAVKRWINNDSRHNTLVYIKNVINNALDVCQKHTCDDTRLEIREALGDSIIGINNLTVTYQLDLPIVASLQILQERTQSYLKIK